MEDLKKYIREIPDWPRPGISFKDITPLLKSRYAFNRAVDLMAHPFLERGVDKVVCIEARGFILGAAVAYKLGAGIVPVRKKGKLPYRSIRASYQLEYGFDELELHEDAIIPGERILIVDDVLATGGTAAAVIELVRKSGGTIIGCSFLIELESLKGREKLSSVEVLSLMSY